MNAAVTKAALLLLYALRLAGAARAQGGLSLSLPVGATDSAAAQLQAELRTLLRLRDNDSARAAYVWPPAALETTALLHELPDAEPDATHSEASLRTYLTNVVHLDSANYLLQLATLGLRDNTPLLQASFELRARRAPSGRFLFYSPLRANTAAWRVQQWGRYSFYYPVAANKQVVKEYALRAMAFDKTLGNAGQRADIYLCDNLPTALRMLGLTYQAASWGTVHDELSARRPGQLLRLSGEGPATGFDLHDLWHQSLRNAVPAAAFKSLINKPVDEGCAYLYGGSWGRSWPEILALFRKRARTKPHLDWAATYEDFLDFGNNPRRPLVVTYVLNALLMEKIRREHGFEAVRQLLCCGAYQPDNENYWQTLARVAGITRANFNATIWQLLSEGAS